MLAGVYSARGGDTGKGMRENNGKSQGTCKQKVFTEVAREKNVEGNILLQCNINARKEALSKMASTGMSSHFSEPVQNGTITRAAILSTSNTWE